MPRRKVLPSQRQRVTEACKLCQEAKKRCSGTAPCANCLRRGLGSSCVISNRPRRQRIADGETTVPNQSKKLLQQVSTTVPAAAPSNDTSNHPITPMQLTGIETSENEESNEQQLKQHTTNGVEESSLPQAISPRMLWNGRGEQGAC
jgi:hypothetical protein